MTRRPPDWLAERAPAGRRRRLSVPVLDAAVSVTLWSPAGLADDDPAPLLVVHDGPAYEREARLPDYLALGDRPVRAALLEVPDRDAWYSANDGYAADLTGRVLPELARRFAAGPVVGMGTSLGALAMLHAHRRAPAAFDGLFLQSGSYFQPIFDMQEAGFSYWSRITAFVVSVVTGTGPPESVPLLSESVPVVMTCGIDEENLHNNRAMAAGLAGRGYPVVLHEVRGGHDFASWRDALDPPLGHLLTPGSGLSAWRTKST